MKTINGWMNRHINWTMTIFSGLSALVASLSYIGIVLSVYGSIDTFSAFGSTVASLILLIPALLICLWGLMRKGRRLLHLLWIVPLLVYCMSVTPAGFFVGLLSVMCMKNKKIPKGVLTQPPPHDSIVER